MDLERLALALIIAPVAVLYFAQASAQVPDSCPVTLPTTEAFTPPSPYPEEAPHPDYFWHGTDRFWTMLKADGTWRGTPPDQGFGLGYRDKVFWWRPGYDGRTEPSPELTVTGRRLDEDVSPFEVPTATNAHHPDFAGWTMLTAVDIPTPGCWEITGRYGSESLTFVVWIVP